MSYTKTTWSNGDTITAEKLNHAEDGIYAADAAAASAESAAAAAASAAPITIQFTLTLDAGTGTLSGSTDADFDDAVSALAAEKTLIGDAVLTTGGTVSHYKGVIGGDVSGDGTADKLSFAAIDSAPGGTGPAVYRVKWDANGVLPSVVPLAMAE